ncbi:CHASE domain-containing protein [Pseudosulfitobacter pseudonitzschiae]|nr:CHASE domain-containing protein [Pseudosulfitobacter pseudonitzschiae]
MRKLDIFLIALFVLITVGMATLRYQTSQTAAQQEFVRLSLDGTEALDTRFDSYLHSLTGVAAFIVASDEVTKQEFDSYVKSLKVEDYLPGVLGMGLIEGVPQADMESFMALHAAPGLEGFEVHPKVDANEHLIISHISPLESNRGALGLDLRFEEARTEALENSRATGKPQMTRRITLVQDEMEQAGFLLVMPVTVPQQAGWSHDLWVYVPFVGPDILSNLTPSQGKSYEISVYDGKTTDPEQLIFDTDPDRENAGAFSTVLTTTNLGRAWTVVYRSTPAYDALFKKYAHILIVIAGTLLTFMLYVALRSTRIRSEAMAEVAEMRARKLNAQEAEKSSILENAVSAVFVLDGDGRVLSANQAALDMFGHDSFELSARAFETLVQPVEQVEPGSRHNAIGQTKDGRRLLLDVQRNDWQSFDEELRKTIIIHDLTEEIRTQDELKNTKTLYDLALQGAQIGVFDVDLTTGTSDVSDTWCRIMGIEPVTQPMDTQTMDTQSLFMERIHPEDRQILINADVACMRGETERSIAEYRIRFDTPDGLVWRWMKSDAIVVERDENGRATRLIGTQTDVTDLRHSRNALEASEKRFRKVISVAPVGMVMMDDQSNITGVNNAFCAVSGYSEDELMAPMRMADLIPPDGRGPIYKAVAEMVAARAELYEGEHQVVHSSGELRWCYFRVSWVYDKNEGRYFYVAQVLDITDQKKVEHMKNEFVATVSHELRTPLTSIKGALGLIRATGGDDMPPATQRLMDIATTNVDRLTSIVNDILDLEKISSGEVTFNFENVDMGGLIRDTVDELSPYIKTHLATVEIDLPEIPLEVFADPGRTKQVLVNLLSNACKYSPDNSAVRIKAERLGGVGIVYIQNEGPGIPEHFRVRIFKAFSQADSSDTRAKGGTGLGLNITRQIVKRHGGEIGFESVPNRVTVFWFTCPLAEAKPLLPPPDAIKPSKNRERLKVLHLEDDLDFAEVIHSGLNPVADVSHAKNLAEARKRLKHNDYDVIVLDWTLPDGDASELLDEVYQSGKKIRIVALSADGSRRADQRLSANLVKSRTDLAGISASVLGLEAQAS